MAIKLASIFFTMILVDNYVLAKFLGICPFLGVSKKLDSAVGMSLAVTFVMVMATAATWPLYMGILAPNGLKAGHIIMTGADADILPGNCLPIANIPVGEMIHNIELYPGKGAQLVRAAGVAAQLMAKENGMAQVRLPSGEVRYIRENCKATIGQVGNTDWANIQLGKAGRKRHMGWRPTVRGSVMNPNDHPHGGGEGKSPVGRPGPVTPWGKPALGYKTRKTKNRTDKFIVKRRNAK